MEQLELFPVNTGGKAHSKIGASSMYRWSKCPGSVKLSEGIESVSSKYAEEGTAAHDLAAKILESQDEVALEKVDSETLEAVMVYVDYVKAKANFGELYVEHKFDLSSLYPGLYGTADAVIYNETEKELIVADYKHGMGIAVEVKDNTQLMYYGLGALLSFKKMKPKTVRLAIIQPRCFHPDGPVREWVLDSFDLLEFAADLVEFAKRTEDPNAPIVAGDHCKFCPAAATKCPVMREKALALAQLEFNTNLSYDPKKLAEALSWVPTLQDWCKSVNEFAYNEAISGRKIPGFKLVEKRATRKWGDEASVSAMARGMDAFPELFKTEIKSPAQIEKVVGKKVFEKSFSEFVVQESSGMTLVPESDKRPERTTAEAAFSDSILT